MSCYLQIFLLFVEDSKMHYVSFLFCIIFLFISKVNSTGYQCCSLFQMDNRGSVLIETTRPLTEGLFEAIRFRSCTEDMFAVQLWECELPSCTLSWTFSFEPFITEAYTYNFVTPVILTSKHRLGFFIPASVNKSLPVPFGVDSSLAFLSESVDTFTAFSQLSPGATIRLKTQTFSRSFAKSIFFCRNQNCRDASMELTPVNPTSSSPFQPPKDRCCQGNSMCNFNSTTVFVDRNQDLINKLTKEMTILEERVLNFSINTFPPPRCPPNFFPGEYGLGSCYLLVLEYFTMAEAALACKDYSESTIVRIDSFQESKYLANFTNQRMPPGEPKKYWMAALYDIEGGWSWYDSNSGIKTPINYNQWENNVKPVPTNQNDICSVFDVDLNPEVGTWRSAVCFDRNFFICEAPKECD